MSWPVTKPPTAPMAAPVPAPLTVLDAAGPAQPHWKLRKAKTRATALVFFKIFDRFIPVNITTQSRD